MADNSRANAVAGSVNPNPAAAPSAGSSIAANVREGYGESNIAGTAISGTPDVPPTNVGVTDVS